MGASSSTYPIRRPAAVSTSRTLTRKRPRITTEITAGSNGLARDPRGSVEELESLGVDRMMIPAFLFFRAGDELASAMAEFTAALR